MSNFLKIIAILAVILLGIGLLGAVIMVATGNTTILLPNITKDGFSFHSFSFKQHGYHETVSRPEKPVLTDSTGLQALDGEITDISLHLGAVEMQILKSDKNALDSTGFNSADLEVSLSNGKLTISTGEDMDFLGNDFSNRSITLYLNSTDFDKVTIEGGASSFFSDAPINCKDFSLSIGMGEYELSNITASASSNIMVGMGEAVLSGTFLKDTYIECGMGSLQMTATGKQSDFGYQIDGGMGRVRFGNDKSSGIGFDRTVNRGTENFFTINCGMGSVDIDFVN